MSILLLDHGAADHVVSTVGLTGHAFCALLSQTHAGLHVDFIYQFRVLGLTSNPKP